MDREQFEDLRRYMSTSEEALRCAYNTLLDYYNKLSNGLTIDGVVFDNDNISKLGKRILDNRNRINDILIREIDDKLMTM